MSLMNSSWLAKIRSDKYMHHPNSDRANKKNQFPKCFLCRLSHLIAATHHLIAIRAAWQKCNERWSMSDICQFTALRCVGRPNNFVLLHFVPLFRLKHMLFLCIVLKSSIIILIYAFLNLSLNSLFLWAVRKAAKWLISPFSTWKWTGAIGDVPPIKRFGQFFVTDQSDKVWETFVFISLS